MSIYYNTYACMSHLIILISIYGEHLSECGVFIGNSQLEKLCLYGFHIIYDCDIRMYICIYLYIYIDKYIYILICLLIFNIYKYVLLFWFLLF